MKYDKQLLDLIKTQPRARERKNKPRAIAYILKQKHPSLKDVTPETLATIVKEVSTLGRQWRHLLEFNPHLRGSDYGNKKQAVDNKLKAIRSEV
jgi:hypothetical protein